MVVQRIDAYRLTIGFAPVCDRVRDENPVCDRIRDENAQTGPMRPIIPVAVKSMTTVLSLEKDISFITWKGKSIKDEHWPPPPPLNIHILMQIFHA